MVHCEVVYFHVCPYNIEEIVLFRDKITAGCLNLSHAFVYFRGSLLVRGAAFNEVEDVDIKVFQLDTDQIVDVNRHVNGFEQFRNESECCKLLLP